MSVHHSATFNITHHVTHPVTNHIPHRVPNTVPITVANTVAIETTNVPSKLETYHCAIRKTYAPRGYAIADGETHFVSRKYNHRCDGPNTTRQ